MKCLKKGEINADFIVIPAEIFFRHCERSEAIHLLNGLPRRPKKKKGPPRNDNAMKKAGNFFPGLLVPKFSFKTRRA
ncbi:MAG TPA: hypothetical protein PKX38_03205 [Alphaproteobacteria bacterium]|jgi:hypothetical protein|nr:hypothetical protein [Micavibrio sp.]MBK9561643.1 hypothetical protein [Micavibrio sp.]MBP7721242.1 hypothetical protein [Alphaproteobacteria bacterium]HQX26926.1 hypothetical protein [Alphaproteobacteria bacterium]